MGIIEEESKGFPLTMWMVAPSTRLPANKSSPERRGRWSLSSSIIGQEVDVAFLLIVFGPPYYSSSMWPSIEHWDWGSMINVAIHSCRYQWNYMSSIDDQLGNEAIVINIPKVAIANVFILIGCHHLQQSIIELKWLIVHHHILI